MVVLFPKERDFLRADLDPRFWRCRERRKNPVRVDESRSSPRRHEKPLAKSRSLPRAKHNDRTNGALARRRSCSPRGSSSALSNGEGQGGGGKLLDPCQPTKLSRVNIAKQLNKNLKDSFRYHFFRESNKQKSYLLSILLMIRVDYQVHILDQPIA